MLKLRPEKFVIKNKGGVYTAFEDNLGLMTQVGKGFTPYHAIQTLKKRYGFKKYHISHDGNNIIVKPS